MLAGYENVNRIYINLSKFNNDLNNLVWNDIYNQETLKHFKYFNILIKQIIAYKLKLGWMSKSIFKVLKQNVS